MIVCLTSYAGMGAADLAQRLKLMMPQLAVVDPSVIRRAVDAASTPTSAAAKELFSAGRDLPPELGARLWVEQLVAPSTALLSFPTSIEMARLLQQQERPVFLVHTDATRDEIEAKWQAKYGRSLERDNPGSVERMQERFDAMRPWYERVLVLRAADPIEARTQRALDFLATAP